MTQLVEQLVELTRFYDTVSPNPLDKHLPLIKSVKRVVHIVPYYVYVQWTGATNFSSFSARLL